MAGGELEAFQLLLKREVLDAAAGPTVVPEVNDLRLQRLMQDLRQTERKLGNARKLSSCFPKRKADIQKLSLKVKELKESVAVEKKDIKRRTTVLNKHMKQLEAYRRKKCEHVKKRVAKFQEKRDQEEQAICDAYSECGDEFVHDMVVYFMQERAKVDLRLKKPSEVSNWVDWKKLNGCDRGEARGRRGLLGMEEKAAKTLKATTEGTDDHEEATWNYKFLNTTINTVRTRMECTSEEVPTPVCELGEADRLEGAYEGLLQDVTGTDSFFVVFASLVIMHYIDADRDVHFCSVDAARLIDEAAHANQERCGLHGQACKDRFMAIQRGGEEVPAKDGEGVVFRKYFLSVQGPDGWHAHHSMVHASEYTGVRKTNIWTGLHGDEDRNGFNVQNAEGTEFTVMCWDTDDQTHQWMLDYPMPSDEIGEDYTEGSGMVIKDAEDEEFFIEGDSVIYTCEDGQKLCVSVVETQPSEDGPVYTLRMPDGQVLEDVRSTHVKTKEEEEEECTGIILKEEKHPQDQNPVGEDTDDEDEMTSEEFVKDKVTSEEFVKISLATFLSFTPAFQDRFVLDMSNEKPILMTYLRHHLVSQYASVEELINDVKALKATVEMSQDDKNWGNMVHLINCAADMWTPRTAF
jgi:hypothetical protein